MDVLSATQFIKSYQQPNQHNAHQPGSSSSQPNQHQHQSDSDRDQPNGASTSPIELAAKEYLEKNIKYYLQNEQRNGSFAPSNSSPTNAGNNINGFKITSSPAVPSTHINHVKGGITATTCTASTSTATSTPSATRSAATGASTGTGTGTTSISSASGSGSSGSPGAALSFFARAAKLSKTTASVTTSTSTGGSLSLSGTWQGTATSSPSLGSTSSTQFSQIVTKLPPYPLPVVADHCSSPAPASASSSSPSVTPIKHQQQQQQQHQQQQPSSGLLTNSSTGAAAPGSRFAATPSHSRQHPLGKVKVILRINSTHQCPEERPPYLQIDASNRHLTLYDPTLLVSYEHNQRPTAPKLFAFDTILESNLPDHHHELSRAALPELINAVMNGNDGVLFALGKSGTHETMLGSDGLMVYAITWLYSALKSSKRRFAIKCTASQITSSDIIDLLANHNSSSCSSPSKSKRLLNSNSALCGLHEMSCTSAKRAAHCLDIATRYYRPGTSADQSNSLLFTLHLYQYKIITTSNGKNTVVGGRSKLHLFDISPQTKNLTNVLLAIFNGQKHVPNKENKLTLVLKECLSSMLVSCSIVANITNWQQNYMDALTTCQFVTRIHRTRMLHLASNRKLSRRLSGLHSHCANDPTKSESDSVNNDENENANHCYTSSSEHSVDTVIFCGKPLTTSLTLHQQTNGQGKGTHSHQQQQQQQQQQPPPVASPQYQRQQQQQQQQQQQNQCQKGNQIQHNYNHSHQQHLKHNQEHSYQIHKPLESKLKSDKLMCDNGTSPLHKSLTNNPPNNVRKSDEQWIDGPKKPKRKPPSNWSKELWVDGPNAQQTDQQQPQPAQQQQHQQQHQQQLCSREVEYMDKQQRIQDWIQQHTKHIWSDIPGQEQKQGQPSPEQGHLQKNTHRSPPSTNTHHCHHHPQIKVPVAGKPTTSAPEMADVSCQTETSNGDGAVAPIPTPSESDWSCCDDEPLRSINEDEFMFNDQHHHYDLERGALSDCCCDAEGCGCSHDDDAVDVHSEPITEPPKQLKLEQFLKQLIAVTAPTRDHKHQHEINHHHHGTLPSQKNYAKLRHPDGASASNLASLAHDWDSPRIDLFAESPSREELDNVPTKGPSSGAIETQTADEQPKNHAPVLPTSPRVNRLIAGSTVAASPAAQSVTSSPSKSSRKQQQQHKRNTTSTTTSGHGTTSEGECSSVAKKSTGSSSVQVQSHPLVVQSQPASSGYDSTIHDDESDRELPPTSVQQQVKASPTKVNTKVKLRDRGSKSKQRRDAKEDRKRNSVSSEKCSFLCCKFLDFY